MEEEIVGIATVVALGGGMFMLSDQLTLVKEHRLKVREWEREIEEGWRL